MASTSEVEETVTETVKLPDGKMADPVKRKRHYNLLGRVTKRTDPDGKVSTWKWDGAANGKGLPQERTYDGTAFKESYAYHPYGRPKTATAKLTVGASTETYARTYGWDAYGRLSTVAHPSGVTSSGSTTPRDTCPS